MSLSEVVFYYLWVAPHVLLLPILAVILRRNLRRNVPIFFSYIAFELIQFVVLFVLAHHSPASRMAYIYAYSLGLGISTALRFGLIHEIFAHIFREYPVLNHYRGACFRWILMGLILCAVLLTTYAGANNSNRVLYITNVLDHTVLILQTSLLLCIFALTQYLNLKWDYPFLGIALGFGIFLSSELIVIAIRFKTGFLYATFLNYVTMAAWHASVLFWLGYLWAPVRTLQAGFARLPQQNDLEEWNRELQRLIHR